MRARLIVFVKEPTPGKIKTRLGRDIGMAAAAGWFRRQTARLLREVIDPRWETILAVSPDTAIASRAWPGGIARYPQGAGDLGARMGRALRAAPGPAIVIGADIPDIRRHHIAEAFTALRQSPAVIGPAADGGYWLVGLRHGSLAPRGAFDKVRWSSRHALTDTLRSLRPLRTAQLETLRDVDTVADLPRSDRR